MKFFNTASYICIEDPFVLDHNVGFNFRLNNIFRFKKILNVIAKKINTRNCMSVLFDNSKKCFPRNDILYPPCNLMCYNIIDEYTHPILSESAVEPKNILKNLRKLYAFVLSCFFKKILNVDFNLTVDSKENLLCSIDFCQLDTLSTFSSFKYLQYFLRTKDNKMKLLKDYKNSHKQEVLTNSTDNRQLFNWFQLQQTSEDGIFYYSFVLSEYIPTNTLKKTRIFSDIIMELLLMVSHSIDRNDPVTEFNNLMEQIVQ